MQQKTITITINEQGNAAIDLEGFEGRGCEKAFEDFRGGDRVTMERKKPSEVREAEESAASRQPDCSLQDRRRRGPVARPQRRCASGPQPNCSLQDAGGGLFDYGAAVAGDSARPPRDDPAGIASDSRDGHPATSSGYPARPGRRGHQSGSCAGDTPGGAAAGMRAGYKRVVEDGKRQAGRLAGSNGNSDYSSGGSGSESKLFILSRNTAELECTEKFSAYRNSYRVFYRVPADGAATRQTAKSAALLRRRQQTMSASNRIPSRSTLWGRAAAHRRGWAGPFPWRRLPFCSFFFSFPSAVR
jgi:hypothetical protein